MVTEAPTTFTTDTGAEFHLEENATSYASELGLKGIKVWRVYAPTFRSFVILDRNTPIYEADTLEAIGIFLDLMAYVERSP